MPRELREMEWRGNILVLSGGDGPEREISLMSGHAVADALESIGARVRFEDVRSMTEALSRVRATSCCAFVALHGCWGEDGRLQVLLESEGLVYTGSGPRACMLAMDKWTSKAVFCQAGVPVPSGFCVPSRFDEDDIFRCREFLAQTGKIVVKPRSCGSTVGFSIVSGESALRDALSLVAAFDEDAIVEEYVDGDEIAVTVLGHGKDVLALPPVMIRPRKGIYDYDSKYTAGATEYLTPPPLAADVLERICDAAVAAHAALGCSVYSRVDLRLTPGGTPKVFEVNAVPGMTATSLVPKAAAAASLSFGDLIGRIVDSSVEERKRERNDVPGTVR
jgi:D-alanine-D-alanine ligase